MDTEKKVKKVRKPVARWTDNLVSTFLLVLYVVLTGVVYTWAMDLATKGTLSYEFTYYIDFALYIGMGLVLFFATRTGDGKTIYRVNWFSIAFILVPVVFLLVNIVLCVSFANQSEFVLGVVSLAFDKYARTLYLVLILFGYAIPYSFISGFEKKVETPAAIPEETEAAAAAENTEEALQAEETVETEETETVETEEK